MRAPTRKATEAEIAALSVITDELVDLTRKHNNVAMMIFAMSRTLPMIWCTNRRFTTVTESLDLWRELNAEMEETIRKNFGAVRYFSK